MKKSHVLYIYNLVIKKELSVSMLFDFKNKLTENMKTTNGKCDKKFDDGILEVAHVAIYVLKTVLDFKVS